MWLLSSPLTQSILLAIQWICNHADVFLLHLHCGYVLLRMSNNPTSLQIFLVELVIVREIYMISNLTFKSFAIGVFSRWAFRTNFSRTALDAVCHASWTYWNKTTTVFMMYFKASTAFGYIFYTRDLRFDGTLF
jgi:hypothetical protein